MSAPNAIRGSAFMASLPPGGDPDSLQAREQLVLDAVTRGVALPITWKPVRTECKGHTGILYVASDTLRFGVPGPNADPSDWDWVRVAVTAATAQRIADALGVLLPTDRILDLAYAQADVRLHPHLQYPVTAAVSGMVAHHAAIEAERAGREGLISTIGKDWILGNELSPPPWGSPPPHALGYAGAINYGWHLEPTPADFAAIARHRAHPEEPYKGPYEAQPGVVVWQTRGLRHGRNHVDYSQWVPRLVAPWMEVDGRRISTVDVMRSPELAGLVSYEGPLRSVRLPEPLARDRAGTGENRNVSQSVDLHAAEAGELDAAADPESPIRQALAAFIAFLRRGDPKYRAWVNGIGITRAGLRSLLQQPHTNEAVDRLASTADDAITVGYLPGRMPEILVPFAQGRRFQGFVVEVEETTMAYAQGASADAGAPAVYKNIDLTGYTLRFPNSFKDATFLGPLKVHFPGLCGGWASTVLDYWHAGVPASTTTTTPSTLGGLGAYIKDRQVDTLTGRGAWHLARFALMLANPVDSAIASQTATSFDELRTAIDAGAPVLLGLIPPWSLNPTSAHQVIAQGYSVDEAGSRTVLILDPNRPLVNGLYLRQAPGSLHWIEPAMGGPERIWRGFFVESGYSPKDPPNADDRVALNDAGDALDFGPATPTPDASARIRLALGPELRADGSREATGTVRAINAFTLDLYRHLAGSQGNVAASPLSVAAALAMALGGARGATAAEMEHVLHMTGSPREASEAVAALARRLAEVPECCTLRIANRLFGDARYTFDPAFCASAARSFGAPLVALDFRGAPEAARERINAWVAEQTNDRIRDLIPEGGVDRATRLVLTNAIYFLGTWVDPFEPSATRPESFNGPLGVRDVPMMHRTGRYRVATVGGAEGAPGAGVKVLDMPYEGNLAMTVVLPDARDGLERVEAALSPELVGRWLDALAFARVAVSLPRFVLRPRGASLRGPLGALGMPGAFSSAADFTGIANPPDPDDRLFVSGVFHQAFVSVDEKGTEAAAATGVAMAARGISVEPDPIVFRADHPFLFLIRDTVTNAILFIGRVEDPAGLGGGGLVWNPQPEPPSGAVDSAHEAANRALLAIGITPSADTSGPHARRYPPSTLELELEAEHLERERQRVARGDAGDPLDWVQEKVFDPLREAAHGTWIGDLRERNREYLKGTWVRDTNYGRYIGLDKPSPADPPLALPPPASTRIQPLVLVPETGDPVVLATRYGGRPVTGDMERCPHGSPPSDETGDAQADQALAGAGKGAAIGAGVGTALEAVPVAGPFLHAAAIVAGAIGGAIAGATQDTFMRGSPPMIGLGLAVAIHVLPSLLFSGIDTITTRTGNREHPAEEHAARLMRYLNLQGHVVPNPQGTLYNPNDFGSRSNSYMESVDPKFPMTDPRYTRRIKRAIERGHALPPDVTTPEQARTLLAALRATIGPSKLLDWSQVRDHLPAFRRNVQHLRALTGERGDDPNLRAQLRGAVMPRLLYSVPRAPARTPVPRAPART